MTRIRLWLAESKLGLGISGHATPRTYSSVSTYRWSDPGDRLRNVYCHYPPVKLAISAHGEADSYLTHAL
jgi:hypothetical protein